MSMTLRAAATFFGFPPAFRRVKRLDPPGARVEPTLPVAPAAKPKVGANGVDVERLLAATRKSAPVELSIIEWDGDSETAQVMSAVPSASWRAQRAGEKPMTSAPTSGVKTTAVRSPMVIAYRPRIRKYEPAMAISPSAMPSA